MAARTEDADRTVTGPGLPPPSNALLSASGVPSRDNALRRRHISARRPATIAASAYFLIGLCMWGKFAFTSGLAYETAFPFMSETSSTLGSFV